MNRPNDTPEVIKLEELETEYSRLQFLVDTGNERIQKEMQISLQAGDLVGKLYDALLKQYNSPASDAELKSLNITQGEQVAPLWETLYTRYGVHMECFILRC